MSTFHFSHIWKVVSHTASYWKPLQGMAHRSPPALIADKATKQNIFHEKRLKITITGVVQCYRYSWFHIIDILNNFSFPSLNLCWQSEQISAVRIKFVYHCQWYMMMFIVKLMCIFRIWPGERPVPSGLGPDREIFISNHYHFALHLMLDC